MLAEVRVAIAAALQARLPDVQCSAYMLANPTPPACHVFPVGTTYDLAMANTFGTMGTRAGTDQWVFRVQLFFPETLDIAAQQLLDRMLEPSGGLSVKEGLEVDGTLGGLVADVSVKSMDGYRRFASESSGPLLGAEWTLEVLSS